MPIFHLKPIAAMLDDPAWNASTHRSEVWVNAPDEAEARGLATGKLENGEANIPGVSSSPSPWMSPALVQARLVESAPSGMKIPDRVVVAG
jgi:hypothetical protein